MGAMRWLAIIPAAIVTVVLFVLMMSLISEEFKPQDKLELAAFEINPKVEDVQLLERETKITKIQKIVQWSVTLYIVIYKCVKRECNQNLNKIAMVLFQNFQKG